MELVEGEALPCPVPIGTALGYARQIAEGLEPRMRKGSSPRPEARQRPSSVFAARPVRLAHMNVRGRAADIVAVDECHGAVHAVVLVDKPAAGAVERVVVPPIQ